MNILRRHGFTLLELVISCAIVVTIFSLATASLTRIHRLRADSESQTRLMTEGRALLDDIANQLAYVAETNIWVSGSTANDGGDKFTLAFIRYAVHPQSRQGGEASDETPYYSKSLEFESNARNNPTSSVERISRSRIDDSAILSSNINHVTYATVGRGSSSTVTNAYAADEMGTHIPAAPKGATISIPVTTGSSVTTYGTRTSFAANLSVLPSPYEGTNTVAADISFANDHSGTRTITIRKPAAVRWPQPSTRTLLIREESQVRADNMATNAFMAAGYLDYTNVPLAIAVFPADETNATVRTSLSSSVETSPTNTPVAGQILYGPYDSPFVVSNYWTWGESAPANTNGIISGVSLVLNGRTNTYASAADVANATASTVTHADANIQFAEILDLLTADLNEDGGPYASLTNLVALAEPVAFTNEFSPKDASGTALPIQVMETLAYEERLSPVDFAAAFSVQSSVAAAGPTATPLLLQSYAKQMDLVIVREVTTNDMTLNVTHDWITRSNYRLLFDVAESLVPTNSNSYGGMSTNIYPNGTSYDSETRWQDIVLEDDFEGSDERTSGIWLREDGRRANTELLVKTNSASIQYAKPKNANANLPAETLSPAIWSSIQKVVITPLCFSTNENHRLDLMVWDPKDDPPGPPVCADIYLELLAPAHQRRARKIPDGERRDNYIQNHVIRISRRAPIGTARKELP